MEGVMNSFKVTLLLRVLRETEENRAECQSEQLNQGPIYNETEYLLQS